MCGAWWLNGTPACGNGTGIDETAPDRSTPAPDGEAVESSATTVEWNLASLFLLKNVGEPRIAHFHDREKGMYRSNKHPLGTTTCHNHPHSTTVGRHLAARASRYPGTKTKPCTLHPNKP
jgi:hypothetical protein